MWRGDDDEKPGEGLDLVRRSTAAMIDREVGAVAAPSKPLLRGVLHQCAFFASLPVGGFLLLEAPTRRAAAAVAIYAVAISALFAVSALYHRVAWSPWRERWMRRLDHTMIFVAIAASYTSFALLIFEGALAQVILVVLWASVVAGGILNVVWPDPPRWFTALVYAPPGFLAAPMLPQFLHHLGILGAGLIVTSGLLAAAGGVIYALRWPDPAPAVSDEPVLLPINRHVEFHLAVGYA